MNSQNNKEEPKLFTFTVPGKPQGKARARTFYNSRSDKMSSVTPEKTTSTALPLRREQLPAFKKRIDG